MKKMISSNPKYEIAFIAAFLSLISVQISAAIAKMIFPILGSDSVALMRLSLSAILLWIMFRPWKKSNRNVYWKDLVCYGVILSLMNLLIYKAFSYLSVGIAISIEVLGPLAIAIFMSRQKLDLIWGLIAIIGLVLLPFGNIANNFSYIGMLYALGAAVCWGLYIVYGTKVAKGGGDSVAIGMAIAALCASPFGIWNISGIFESSWIFLLCLLVSLFSSTIPFLLDIFAMKTLPPKFFGILLSTSPVISALSGWIILDEKLSIYQVIGIIIIMISCLGCFIGSYKKSTPHLT